MIQSKSFEKNTYGDKPGNPYVLALFTARKDREKKIGCSFSLNDCFDVEEGDIYIAFKVIA
jgi:hypothetical protein